MDYEKNKDALAIVKQMVVDGQVSQEVAEKYFPELVEIEGEKIRKWIISYLENRVMNTSITDEKESCLDAISWLKNQGEQKPPKYSLEQAAGIFLDALSLSPYNNKPITDAQIITKELLKFLSDSSTYNPDALNNEPVEWRDKDEEYMKSILNILHGTPSLTPNEIINHQDWFKSKLKTIKLQNTWKPTEEQMEALDFATDCIWDSDYQYKRKLLKELLEQLKAL